MSWYKRFKQSRILQQHAIPDHDWRRVTHQLPLLATLSASEKARLRVLATHFIYNKSFEGVHGVEVSLEMQIVVAAQACLETLTFGPDSFNGWRDIIIYPGAFRINRPVQDENGLMRMSDDVLSGEAWMRGPVILSWQDVERDSFQIHHGQHVVLHEFAHKLDMLNGRANGMPPLHPQMQIAEWTQSLSKAYTTLISRIEQQHNAVNPYAATNPAEFFAVMCEYFFTAPELLNKRYPAVYRQLQAYFRQDPLQRG